MDRDAALSQMLRQLPLLLAVDEAFGRFLSKTPFVPVASGELRAPASLYDPR